MNSSVDRRVLLVAVLANPLAWVAVFVAVVLLEFVLAALLYKLVYDWLKEELFPAPKSKRIPLPLVPCPTPAPATPTPEPAVDTPEPADIKSVAPADSSTWGVQLPRPKAVTPSRKRAVLDAERAAKSPRPRRRHRLVEAHDAPPPAVARVADRTPDTTAPPPKELALMTHDDLLALAKARGVRGANSRWSKAKLVDAVRSSGPEGPRTKSAR